MYIKGLDYVRFLSAISVLFYHYFARHNIEHSWDSIRAISQFGYLGVPCFFILSGFVIAYTANNQTPLRFIISRFFRLIPTLWLCILITSLIAYYFDNDSFKIIQVLANFTTLNEYVGIKDIDIVYWSLKAEIKFYALVFFLIVFGLFNHKFYWLLIWFLLVVSFHTLAFPSNLGWFISPHFSSYFIVGICLFQMKEHKSKGIITLFILSSILSIIMGFEQAENYIRSVGDYDRFVASGLTFLIITGFTLIVLSPDAEKKPKRNSVLLLAGLTYPLYLLHNKAGSLFIINYEGAISTEFMILLVTLSVLLVSLAIHYYFERIWVTGLKRQTEKFILRREQS